MDATKRVYNILFAGGRYSTRELCYFAKVSDPRSAIRTLRNKGVNIKDTLIIDKELKTRYKLYWLERGNA